ncbi:MAG: alpha/beta fold hydrolase [Myxococcales bacterium]|nr:alpha/beta fold hydrolase [Myxococcales bacterium]
MPWDPSRAKGVAIRSAAMLLGLYTLALTAIWALQERLLFHPEVLPADHDFAFGADVHEVAIDVPGARLVALHLRNPDPAGVVFYLHGNGGSLEGWFANAEVYRRINFDLFMVDYRGYGKSTGAIEDEAQLRGDVRAAWDTIAAQYAGRRRVIVGRSLGTALAAGLAAEAAPEQTILVSPYQSMLEMADLQFPWVPHLLLRYPLRTQDDAARVHGPLMILHGERDGLIPIAQAEAIAAGRPGTELVRVSEAGHDDIHEFPAYQEAFVRAVTGAAQ